MDEKIELKISTPEEDLENALITSDDLDELNSVIDLINLNFKKKEILRAGKLNQLQDQITDQMTARITKHAGEFSNKDLLDYFKVIQETTSKQDVSLKSINTPAIQINQQNNINIESGTVDTLNRESREKVADAIKSILNKYSNDNIIEAQLEENNGDELLIDEEEIIEVEGIIDENDN